jgi:hypothetical protein
MAVLLAHQLDTWVKKAIDAAMRARQGKPKNGWTAQTYMNAINLIIPYRYEGMWVFDDPRVGLDKEPFVSGADAMIDVLVADLPNAQYGGAGIV